MSVLNHCSCSTAGSMTRITMKTREIQTVINLKSAVYFESKVCCAGQIIGSYLEFFGVLDHKLAHNVVS